MTQVLHRLGGLRLLALASVLALAAVVNSAAAGSNGNGSGDDRLQRINHIVVIYEENHSFDNLYGGWEGVNGLANAAGHITQVDQAGSPLPCLPQNDANLSNAVPPAFSCTAPNGHIFPNLYFSIDAFIPPTAITCPPVANAFAFPFGLRDPGINPMTGLPVANARSGGCTRDLVHRFYQEQFQIDGGRMDRYVLGSDSIGTSMGVYDTKALPIYKYLHSGGHPHYAIADDFFQAAFGGSFLNHQWLIAAATPTFPDAPPANYSILDARGFPNSTYPLYSTSGVRDAQLTQSCVGAVPGFACGPYVVNTSQPSSPPFGGGLKIPLQTHATIGDRLTAAGISWDWYAGGWNDAVAGHPDPLFQFHHQPFNYFANYAPGTLGRAHLQDETAFEQKIADSGSACQLPDVSFDKPIGEENEHPGYASEPNGSDHLVDLITGIENSLCAKDTMVIVTYDEFGGQWDHVPPPGQAGDPAAPGRADEWGPGTRIPALIVSPFLRGEEVIDHTQYDTTSILATIEERYGLAPLSRRDAAVNSLSNVYDAKEFNNGG